MTTPTLITGDWLFDPDSGRYRDAFTGIVTGHYTSGVTWKATRDVVEQVVAMQQRERETFPVIDRLLLVNHVLVQIPGGEDPIVVLPDSGGLYEMPGWTWCLLDGTPVDRIDGEPQDTAPTPPAPDPAPQAREPRKTWTTAKVRARDVNLDDVVMHDGHAWEVLDGEAWDSAGEPLDDDAVPSWQVTLNLLRPRWTTSTRGDTTPSTPFRYTLRVGATDLVTVQVPA